MGYNNEVTTYKELINKYNQFYSLLSSISYYKVLPDYTNFVKEQMQYDATALNYSLKEIVQTTDKFVLPADYNENNERIIAMITYFNIDRVFDSHYYLRNGNGTCPKGHGNNCSIWTHKQGNDKVKSTCSSNKYNNVILCDQTIEEYATKLNLLNAWSDVYYYRLNKNVNVYDSWHDDGRDSINNNGTPYRP